LHLAPTELSGTFQHSTIRDVLLKTSLICKSVSDFPIGQVTFYLPR